jgi:serine/threonine protein kinase
MRGTTILHYEFLEKIGSGGMGEVFKAHDKRLNRHVAIKALPYGMSADPERRRRFIQEAQTASALNHPNIITIHDVFHEGDTHFIVMEYVPGLTLLASIPATGMRIGEMLLCSAQMASALRAAHEAGIVHRDFKPANVMIGNSGLVKILDFGLAKLLQPQSIVFANAAGASGESATIQIGVPPTISGAPQTAEGSILGTVNYMSPEQAEGKKVDARADIFALGAVMYEMLTGQRAFQGESDIATLSAVLRDEVKPISGFVSNVPPELDNLIRVCLRKDPNSRWQTMAEVEVALIALKRRSDAGEFSGRHVAQVRGAEPQAKRPTIFTRFLHNRKKMFVAGGALALLMVASSAFLIFKFRHHVPPPMQTIAAPAQPAPTPPSPQPVADASSAPSNTPAPATVTAAAPAAPKNGVPLIPAPPAAAPNVASVPPAAILAPIPVPESPKPAKAEAAPKTAVQPVTVSIGDGIAFSVALAEDVRNDAEQGSELTFRAAEDVKVGEVLVIARGAAVKGSVVNGNGKRILGMGGKMTFQLTSAETVDGQKIPVRASITRRADGPTARPIDTGRYAKPKDIAAARGTDYVAYIDGDHTITLSK